MQRNHILRLLSYIYLLHMAHSTQHSFSWEATQEITYTQRNFLVSYSFTIVWEQSLHWALHTSPFCFIKIHLGIILPNYAWVLLAILYPVDTTQPMPAHYYLQALLSPRQNLMMPSTIPLHMSNRHLRSASLTQRALLVPVAALTRTHTLTHTQAQTSAFRACWQVAAERGLLRRAGSTWRRLFKCSNWLLNMQEETPT